jgi:hypothetical protein
VLTLNTSSSVSETEDFGPCTSISITCALSLESAMSLALTLSNPRLCAAKEAQAIVLTLFGASGHRSRTGPSYTTNSTMVIHWRLNSIHGSIVVPSADDTTILPWIPFNL